MDVGIRAIGLPQQNLLIGMYDQFDPLGLALGLPPWRVEARHQWIEVSLSHKVNVAAFSPSGEVVGHCFLASGDADSAELAVFVLQGYRERGVGTALVKAVLEWGIMTGLHRVWTLTASDNEAALRLQRKCGFRLRNSSFLETEMEIDLSRVSVTPHRCASSDSSLSQLRL